MHRVVVAVAFIVVIGLVGGQVLAGAQEEEPITPFVVIVNEFGTPCPEASPVGSPAAMTGTDDAGQVATPLGSPAASPIPVVLPGCVQPMGTPAT